MTDPFVEFVRALHQRQVRFVVIGVWGANYYAPSGGAFFHTYDRDLFLPPDPENLLRVWQSAEDAGVSLWVGDEPLDMPRDLELARAVVERRALVRATGARGLLVDLTLVMAGFDFDTVWPERRIFPVESVEVPVARLMHIVTSKATANRDKDRLFLATHEEALRQLLDND